MLLLLCCAFSSQVAGQQFYACTNFGTLKQVTINPDGTATIRDVFGCGNGSFWSIAITGNTIYYSTSGGDLYSGDLTGGNNPAISNCVFITSGVYGNSLTVNDKGIIYSASGNLLYSIDPANPSPTLLASMPFSAAGDLMFYEKELYMAAYEGIVKIPLSDPSTATLYIPIPNQAIYAMTTTSVKNGPNKVYALTAGGNGTNILDLDMVNKTVKGIVGTVPFVAYDAGSNVEAGVIPTIVIEGIDVTQECDVYNKGRAQVNTTASLSQYTYTVNGISNTTGIFDNLAPGDYHVDITSNGNEAPKSAPFTVPDYSLAYPTLAVSQINPICDIKGQLTPDAGAANASYNIKLGNNIYPLGHVFTGLDAGAYHFTILKLNGCLAFEKDYTLVQETCPPIIINNVIVVPECNIYGDASVTILTQPHPDNYTYTFKGVTNTTGVFNFVTPGTFTLTITSSGGDTKEQQVVVPDYTLNKPGISVNVKNAVCTLLGQVKFTITGNGQGATEIRNGADKYKFGENITGLNPGINHFTVFNQAGCIVDEIDVTIGQDECRPVNFPNTFTPNGDGINEIFRPNQDSAPTNYKLEVFNRWGQRLFMSLSPYIGWDGTYNGKPAPVGVYYWIANYTSIDEKRSVQTGHVTLIR